MAYFSIKSSRKFNLSIAIASFFICANCYAISRMLEVKISDINGLPCFSAPENSDRSDDLQLTAIVVTKKTSDNWKIKREEFWRFNVEPNDNPINLSSKSCILYGETPTPAKGTFAKKLLENQIYVVSFGVKASLGTQYSSEFCIKNNVDTKVRVQVIPWDKEEKKWRYDLCIE
jgi:hypothetical protein